VSQQRCEYCGEKGRQGSRFTYVAGIRICQKCMDLLFGIFTRER